MDKKTKTKSSANSSAKVIPPNEESKDTLIAIRDLLFGQQVNQLELSIQSHFQQMSDRISALESRLDEKSKQIEKSIHHTTTIINQTIETNQTETSSHESLLDDNIQLLKKSLAEFQQQTDSEFNNVRSELSESSNSINDCLMSEVKALSDKIDLRAKELGNNKADRKTLANLLESMAVNLNQN